MSHAKLPPSSAAMWVKCTGWYKMNEPITDEEESEDSRIGTAVHELAAHMIDGYTHSVGETASNGVVWDEEMFECAEAYVMDVQSVIMQYPFANFNTETHVSIGYVHEENSGTPDFDMFDPETRTIYIWDYKHGHGIVEAFENWQLLDYLVGIMWREGVNEIYLGEEFEIHLRVVQPRAFHRDGAIREWVLKSSDVRGYATTLKQAAHANMSDEAICQSGTHCKYCKARHTCSAAIQCGLGMIEVLSQPTPFDMSPEAMGTMYSIIKRAEKHLESLKASLEAQISSKLKQGVPVENWELTQSYGREKWSIPFEEAVGIGEMHGVDIRKKECVTPKQAITLGVDAELVRAYSITPTTGLKLTQIDLNRVKRTFL